MAIAEIIGTTLAVAVGIIGLGAIALEAQYRRRSGNRLELRPGTWQVQVRESDRYLLVGELELHNCTRSLEIMVPEVSAQVKLLSKGSLEGIECRTRVIPLHPDAPAREDDYWFAYIVKAGKTTQFKISIDLRGGDLERLQSAWVRVGYMTYGPEGRIPKLDHIVVPLQYPDPDETALPWRDRQGVGVLPIKTHLLTHLDDPVELVKRYVMPHAQPGDVVTLGETPLAIIQGRWRYPADVKPGWVARRLCYYFLPTSSLATACGLQTLVDLVGSVRVFAAFAIGAIARLAGQRGVFYQLAGEQARLIDDVTGTLPPYDQFIVLGPQHPQRTVDRIQAETGLSAAIVDANDLKAVKILAATPDLSTSLLETALQSNPAGNADEQTPLVLIRPNPSESRE